MVGLYGSEDPEPSWLEKELRWECFLVGEPVGGSNTSLLKPESDPCPSGISKEADPCSEEEVLGRRSCSSVCFLVSVRGCPVVEVNLLALLLAQSSSDTPLLTSFTLKAGSLILRARSSLMNGRHPVGRCLRLACKICSRTLVENSWQP